MAHTAPRRTGCCIISFKVQSTCITQRIQLVEPCTEGKFIFKFLINAMHIDEPYAPKKFNFNLTGLEMSLVILLSNFSQSLKT